jgi:S-adenosylmethionine synthetase
METKRLIPYSVHLSEEIYNKLKEAAKERKATGLVRDAVTMYINGEDEFNGGYNKALRDIASMLQNDDWATSIAINGVTLADHFSEQVLDMVVIQNTKKRK